MSDDDLLLYWQDPKGFAIRLKRHLFDLFDRQCAYCGSDGIPLTKDHVIPKAKGGETRFNNLVPACKKCNNHKSDKPVEDWYRNQSFFCEKRWLKIRIHTADYPHQKVS